MDKRRWLKIGAVLLILSLLLLPLLSCSQITAGGNQSSPPSSTQALEDRINGLEKRVAYLEQTADERVNEFNAVQSAVYKMIIENGLFDQDWGSISLGAYNSNWAPTNDMHLFPSPTTPLFGYDKNRDGKPDTNYVSFNTSKWFYQYYDKGQIQQFPDLGWNRLTKRPSLEELQNQSASDSFATELHNIQTAVMAMLAESKTGMMVAISNTNDMDNIKTTDTPPLVARSYLTGLNPDGTVKSGCTYTVKTDGSVTQTKPK